MNDRHNGRPVALVTGASGGIGEELARELARRGYDLALVARTKDKLERLGETLRVQYGTASPSTCPSRARRPR